MGDKTRIIKNSILVKIYWKDDIEKNEKKTTKERIVLENEGKLCIVFQRNLREYIPNSIVTIIPQQNFKTIITALIKHYETEGYKTEHKENNITIISNEHNDDNLKISLKIFKQKMKILIQSNPSYLLKFIESYVKILKSITEKHDKGQKNANLFEIIFGENTRDTEVDLKPDFEVDRNQMLCELSTVIADDMMNDKDNVHSEAAGKPVSDESKFEQKSIAVIMELKEAMKDIQNKLDKLMPINDKLNNIEKDLKSCKAQCLCLEEDIQEMNGKVTNVLGKEKDHNMQITSNSSKIANLITRQSKIELDIQQIPQLTETKLKIIASKIEENITKKLNDEFEKAIKFSTFRNAEDPIKKTEHQSQQPKHQQKQQQQHNLGTKSYSNTVKTPLPVHQQTKPRTQSQPHQSSHKNPLIPDQTQNASTFKVNDESFGQNPTINETQNQELKYFEQENILIGDSNIKFISATRFNSPIGKIRCGSFKQLPETLRSICLPNAKKIILHLGTNDIEDSGKEDFASFLHQSIELINSKCPNAVIICSEILRRYDNQNNKVAMANKILEDICDYTSIDAPVVMTYHSYIDETMLVDHKHLNRQGLKIFISDLKSTFFGVKRRKEYTEW
eukprot:Seg13340.1 transcript_id=Seg13340.1/GoldUCD/mRNA.D3Y31 product="hypothetical protein" protein_id=Seg13340.1/GoldUCD/D3Y31